jgi:hypothetical protein
MYIKTVVVEMLKHPKKLIPIIEKELAEHQKELLNADQNAGIDYTQVFQETAAAEKQVTEKTNRDLARLSELRNLSKQKRAKA